VASSWPWGTFLANVLGSCALGVLFAAAEEGGWLGPELRLALGVGVLGGFTTYSSFNLEAIRMAETGTAGRALLYVTGTVLLCAAAGLLGIVLGRMVPPR
jgi:CrcB protein